MKNLATAIIAVMKAVKGMEKNSRVGKGTTAYDGTKDKDVKEVFNKALAENGLCILPISIEPKITIERWEEVDQWSKTTPKAMKTKQSVFTEVNAKYLLLHESGESVELAGYGHGTDPQDKGAGKATTYALKNCLLYNFLTPVGKIEDTDKEHSLDKPVPKVKKAPKKLAPKAAQPKPKAIKDSELEKIITWVVEKNIPIEKVSKYYTLTKVQNEELKERVDYAISGAAIKKTSNKDVLSKAAEAAYDDNGQS
jgi:hypothetical protein